MTKIFFNESLDSIKRHYVPTEKVMSYKHLNICMITLFTVTNDINFCVNVSVKSSWLHTFSVKRSNYGLKIK